MNYHVCHDSNWACRCGIVTRDEMLAEIWNTPFTDSNKVEAVVRSLRTKLGPYASSIENRDGPRLPLSRMEAECDRWRAIIPQAWSGIDSIA